MNFNRIPLIFGCLAFAVALIAQSPDLKTAEIFYQLEKKLSQGEPQALRDLGTFLDQPAIAPEALFLLKEYCLFTNQELDFRKPLSRQQFLDFYYENEKRIKFSELLQAFYMTPVENLNASYDIFPGQDDWQPPSPQADLHQKLSAFITRIKQTGKVNPLLEARLKVLDELEKEPEKNPEIFILAADFLSFFRDELGFQTICKWVKNGQIPANKGAEALAKLSNLQLKDEAVSQDPIELYVHWHDSLKTIEAMREAGYQKILGTRKSFFEEEVDYFGRVLSLSTHFWWIQQNAFLDLVQAKHPRCLFYLSSIPFKNRRQPGFSYFKPEEIYQLLNHLSGIQLAVQGADGMIAPDPELDRDGFALRNFLFFWAGRHVDFVWQDERQGFMDQVAYQDNLENFERLFRRLNAENDSVALAAYWQLLESPPTDLATVSSRFKDLIQEINQGLPDWKYPFLERLNELIFYCQKKEIPYHLNAYLERMTARLTFARSEKERFDIENEIIRQLPARQVSAFEIWSFFQFNHPQNALSAGRILRLWYQQHFCSLAADSEFATLFLKKATLFEKMGANGFCGQYFPIGLDNYPCLFFFSQNAGASDKDGRAFLTKLDFLEKYRTAPLDAIKQVRSDSALLIWLPSPADSVLVLIQNENSIKGEKFLLNWSERFPKKSWTGIWLDFLDDPSGRKKAKSLLENTYGIATLQPSPDEKKWKIWWKKSGRNPEKLEQLIRSHFEKIQPEDNTELSNFLSFWASDPSLTEKEKKKILTWIQKEKPVKDLWKLQFFTPLDPAKDLWAFENLDIPASDLGDLLSFFEPSRYSELMPFFFKKTAALPNEVKAAFFNEILRRISIKNSTFIESLASGNRKELIEILQTYLSEGLLISESEEIQTYFHLTELSAAGNSINHKIKIALEISPNNEIREKVLNLILAKIDFSEIGPVLNSWQEILQKTGREPRNFIQRDFGIPFFDLRNDLARQQFLERYRTLPPRDLYKTYLLDFGLDFLDEKARADLHKITFLLENEFTLPFAGPGGLNRADFLFGLIKFLEFEFDTPLGFHPKLNENQSFFEFTPLSRAQAWSEFLKSKTR